MYLQICQLKLIGSTQLNKFMRDAEAFGMIEGNGMMSGYRWLIVTPVGDAFLNYCDSVNISERET